MASTHRLWPVAIAVICAAAFYLAQRLPSRVRAVLAFGLSTLIYLSPLLISSHPRYFRLAGTLLAVTLGVKLYDLHHSVEHGIRLGPRAFALHLFNPLAIVLPRVLHAPRPPIVADLRQFVIGSFAGSAAILLTIRVFQIDWRAHPFVMEHCAKLLAFFLTIQFLPNAFASLFRLLGIPSTDFCGPFFLARTPAEFWRLYNRPAEQFFHEYVFKPAGGPGHLIRAALVTFAFSGIVHEYVFDVPAGRVLGTQMAFFLIQGLAVIATIRLRPRGWLGAPAVVATLAFNLLTGLLFFSSMNAVLPFYVSR